MPETLFKAPASLIAALLLLLREFLPGWNGLPKTVAETLALAGAGKSQAYAMLDRLRDLLPTMIGTPGRPASLPTGPCDHCDAAVKLLMAVRRYLVAHPGSACGTGTRYTYSDGFRRFVVGLLAPGQPGEGMTAKQLAHLTGVPPGTLHDWLYPKHCPPTGPAPTHEASKDSGDEEDTGITGDLTVRSTQALLIANLWPKWEGTFQAFCQMLRTEYRLRRGDTFIGSLLQGLGLRHRRPHSPVEAPWSSNTYRRLFPGAQWLGDGTDIRISWGNEQFVFNLEAILDVASTAMMGIDISRTENEKALHHAYEEGKITSGGAAPLAVTLDNKPCNHSPDAQDALKDTILLRATPGRGQAKAPLEGTFGLFAQELPPLVITGNTSEEMAASALRLIATAYFRGRNGRPRKRLENCSPIDAYTHAKATPEELEEARKWLQELQRRQERARLTREARLDPVRLNLLKVGLADLGIPDPSDRLAKALAYYSREAIARGLATFKSKQDLGTLPPPENHGSYLGGIIKNLHTRLELDHFATHILQQRIRLHDLTVAPLNRAADQIRRSQTFSELPQAFVDQALDATYTVDFHFWSQAAAEALAALPATHRKQYYHALTRRIAASFNVERERRADLIDCLAAAMASAAA